MELTRLRRGQEVRRHKHMKGAWKPLSIFDALDNLCPHGVLRHDERVDEIYEVCDEMMDEHVRNQLSLPHCPFSSFCFFSAAFFSAAALSSNNFS